MSGGKTARDDGQFLVEKESDSSRYFLSYARKDIAFVKKIEAALSAVDSSVQVWVDWMDILPSEAWREEVQKGISNADCFICVLSAFAPLKEDIISAWEVGFALNLCKRLVVVVVGEYAEISATCSPNDLAPFSPTIVSFPANASVLDDNGAFTTAMHCLRQALQVDSFTRLHTKLLGRAQNWEKKARDPCLLLHGQDRERACAWLQHQEESKLPPQPSALHQSFVKTSLNYDHNVDENDLLYLPALTELGQTWLLPDLIRIIAEYCGVIRVTEVNRRQCNCFDDDLECRYTLSPDKFVYLHNSQLDFSILHENGEVFKTLSLPSTMEVSAIRQMANGNLLVAGVLPESDFVMKLWTPEGEFQHVLEGKKTITKILELKNGDMATGFQDGSVKIWHDWRCVQELQITREDDTQEGDNDNSVIAFAECPNGDLVSGHVDANFHLWRNGQCVQTSRCENGRLPVTALVVLPNNDIVVGQAWKGTIEIWRGKKRIDTLKGHSSTVVKLLSLANGDLVSASKDKTIRVWRNGICVRTLYHHEQELCDLKLLPNSGHLQSVCVGGLAIEWFFS